MRRAELAPRRQRHNSCSMQTLEQRRMLAVDVAIDVDTRFQQIDGFGTAISDYTGQSDPNYQTMFFQDMRSSMMRRGVDYRTLTPTHAANPGTAELSTPVTLGPDILADTALFNFETP